MERNFVRTVRHVSFIRCRARNCDRKILQSISGKLPGRQEQLFNDATIGFEAVLGDPAAPLPRLNERRLAGKIPWVFPLFRGFPRVNTLYTPTVILITRFSGKLPG